MHRALAAGIRIIGNHVNGLLDIIYPPACGICGLPADSDDRLICPACWEAIRGLDAPYCLSCRRFLDIATCRCPDCGEQSLAVFSLGHFDDSLRVIIHDIKFAGLRPLARTVGAKLAHLVSQSSLRFDIIIPVPLHQSRFHKRGFNQSEEIAREIGRVFDIPLNSDIIYMTRKTRQQAKLPASEREANVRGAYDIDDSEGLIRGRRVLLVDDVSTTGATLMENKRILMAAGAERVDAAVAATAV